MLDAYQTYRQALEASGCTGAGRPLAAALSRAPGFRRRMLDCLDRAASAAAGSWIRSWLD